MTLFGRGNTFGPRSPETGRRTIPTVWPESKAHGRRPKTRFRRIGLALAAMAAIGFSWWYLAHRVPASPPAGSTRSAPSAAADVHHLTRKQVAGLMAAAGIHHIHKDRFEIRADGKRYLVQTNLDPSLQNVLLQSLDKRYTQYIGIVALDPHSGKIRAMVGYDRADPKINPCVDARYPAASLFKIVTAAAAVKDAGLSPKSSMHFNGAMYTLYRRQLKNKVNRWSERISLERAFAESVNPVFGKLGANRLGPEPLEHTAEALGFNRPLPFEMHLPESVVAVDDDPYKLAEVASGFNRQTRITPIHGALLAAAVVNGGWLVAPTLVDTIWNTNGRTPYEGHRVPIGRALSEDVAKKLHQMMEETVRVGTCRRWFHPYRSDRMLSRLTIGAKSGSIDNAAHDVRLDWFVGFAQDKKSDRSLALGIVVGHGKYLGRRAGEYARLAIRHFFGEPKTSAGDGAAGN